MFWIDVVSRVLHVSTAILLLGGSLFSLLVLRPVMANQSSNLPDSLAESLRNRWKRWVHTGIALFLVTGFYNYFRAMPLHKGDGLYHALVGTKILVALFVFFLASVLVGRSPRFEHWRRDVSWPLALLCLLGLGIVIISGFVKVSSSAVQ
jgi:uncharacterized membrane protein